MGSLLKFGLGVGLWAAFVGAVWALPSLQLGPGSGSWSYVGGGDDTWYVTDSAFSVTAYANALTESNNPFVGTSGNGASQKTADNTSLTAYLVFSAVPSTTSTTPFDLSVSGGSGPLALVQQGYGSPPDPGADNGNDDLAPHSIYDTYFYIYEFAFDGVATTISDTQPGQTGSGQGYMEQFNVVVNAIESGITGVHMDLFTVSGDGKLQTTDGGGNPIAVGDLSNQIFANAPFSHDGQYTVPEPAVLWLLGMGVLGLCWQRSRGR